MDINYYVENYDLSSSDYNRIHALRFSYSYAWIEEFLSNNIKVLELGSSGLFSYIIKDLYPEIEITNTITDLRYEFDFKSDYFDLILNMEIIEHIKDKEPKDSQDFHELSLFSMTGVKSFLSECYRVLKPEGLMFLTTPNMNSLQNIDRILNYLSPMNYYPHVREYSIGELVNWAKEHNFEVMKIGTYDVLGDYKPDCRANIISLLAQIGVSTEYRGDNIFMLLKKVAPLKTNDIVNNDILIENLPLRDLNLIIFPDWTASEELLFQEIEAVIRRLANHPDQSQINLLIDTSNIDNDDANLLLSSITMNLMMTEDLDISDKLEIFFLGTLAEVKWEEMLPRLTARIILENENQEAMAEVGVNAIPSWRLDNLSSE